MEPAAPAALVTPAVSPQQYLQQVDPKDLKLIAMLANPPALVHTVSEAVLIVLGRPRSKKQSAAHQMCAEPDLVGQLSSINVDGISSDVLAKLEPFINNADFTVATLSTKAQAAGVLCGWVRAVYDQAKGKSVVGAADAGAAPMV
jgi:hypothetical protein